jgi:hypothetical protein
VRIEGTITAGFTFTGSPPGAALSMTDQIGAEVLPTPPTLSITQVAGVNAPPAPTSSFATPDVVLPATTPASVTVNVAATQIPPGTTVNIFVRGLSGAPTGPVTATLTGTLASSTASATVTIPLTQPAIITASVTYIRTADAAGGPMYVDGEPIERVRVATGTGGRSDVTYITRSGREVVVASR